MISLERNITRPYIDSLTRIFVIGRKSLNPIGVGIIGAGNWGRKLAARYLDAEQNGRVKLIKICDISIPALGELLMAYETESIKSERLSLETLDIMKNDEISAVHIATPCSTHSAFSRMALEAGKNVLVEKPISLNSFECRQLIEFASEKGLIIEETNDARFNRGLQATSEMIRRGDLGKIRYARVQWSDAAKFSHEDILFVLGPEPICMLGQLLGELPNEVSGVAKAYGRSTHNELIHIFAQYSDGVFAHIELNGLHPRAIREVVIVGSTATLDVDCSRQRIVRYSSGKITEIPITPTDTVAGQITHFIGRIAHGDFAVDSEAVRTIETLETVQSSLWTRVPRINQRDLLEKPTQNAEQIPILETAVGLLEIVHKGANKTPILNEGELNPDLVSKYLGMLEKIGLVDGGTRPDQKAYVMTTKGLQFLIDYYESQRLGEITDNTRRVLQAVGLGTV